MLLRFYAYLQNKHIELCALGIEHLDGFMATFKVAQSSLKNYRHYLRGFLKYLHHEKGILKKVLAPLLVGSPLFDQGKPPRFLRPGEVKKLFGSLSLSTPLDIRDYALVHLSYTLGLRPVEISRATLDDLSFKKRELALRERKADHPITLPVPENTLKAIAAYVLKARPKNSRYRHLFLSFQPPYKPLSSYAVTLLYLQNDETSRALLHKLLAEAYLPMLRISWRCGAPSIRSKKCWGIKTSKPGANLINFPPFCSD